MGYFFEAGCGGQEQMHRLHVLAVMVLTHAALANLVPRGGPATGVINVSSVAAFGSSPQNASYCATKAWMNAFTQALATELGAKGSPVKVQALCPGFTLSEFHDAAGIDRATIPRPVDDLGLRGGTVARRVRPRQVGGGSGLAL